MHPSARAPEPAPCSAAAQARKDAIEAKKQASHWTQDVVVRTCPLIPNVFEQFLGIGAAEGATTRKEQAKQTAKASGQGKDRLFDIFMGAKPSFKMEQWYHLGWCGAVCVEKVSANNPWWTGKVLSGRDCGDLALIAGSGFDTQEQQYYYNLQSSQGSNDWFKRVYDQFDKAQGKWYKGCTARDGQLLGPESYYFPARIATKQEDKQENGPTAAQIAAFDEISGEAWYAKAQGAGPVGMRGSGSSPYDYFWQGSPFEVPDEKRTAIAFGASGESTDGFCDGQGFVKRYRLESQWDMKSGRSDVLKPKIRSERGAWPSDAAAENTYVMETQTEYTPFFGNSGSSETYDMEAAQFFGMNNWGGFSAGCFKCAGIDPSKGDTTYRSAAAGALTVAGRKAGANAWVDYSTTWWDEATYSEFPKPPCTSKFRDMSGVVSTCLAESCTVPTYRLWCVKTPFGKRS